MKTPDKNSLVKFYFGSLPETQRLAIEKEMLVDPEVLLDYLDLKRELEASEKVPAKPSALLWQRLRPLFRTKKAWYLSFAVGGALAAAMAAYFFMMSPQNLENNSYSSGSEILFDSGAEHSFTSDVL